MAWTDISDPLAQTWPSASPSSRPGPAPQAPEKAQRTLLLSAPPETKRRCEQMYQQLSYRPPMRRAWVTPALALGVAAVGAVLLGLLV